MAYSPNNPWVGLINPKYPFAQNMADSWEKHHATDTSLAPLASSLTNQQGNTLQLAGQLAQSANNLKYNLPLDLAQVKTRLAENRGRVNQNFGPNRARRAFYSGI